MHWIAIGIALIVFLLLPRRMSIPIAIAALLYAGWAYRNEPAGGASAGMLARVHIYVEYSAAACSLRSPLRVTIENGSGQRVSRVSWDIGANGPGTSSNVVSSIDFGAGYFQAPFSRAYTEERLLLPGETAVLCLDVPPLEEGRKPAELNWFIIDKEVRFLSD